MDIRLRFAKRVEKTIISLARKDNLKLKNAHTSSSLKPQILITLKKPNPAVSVELQNSFIITKTNIYYINQIGSCSKITLNKKKTADLIKQLPHDAFTSKPLSIKSFTDKPFAEEITRTLYAHKRKIQTSKKNLKRKYKVKLAMLILGVQGVFKLNAYTPIRGAGFDSAKIRKYLSRFSYQFIKDSKDEDLIKRIQAFKQATRVNLKTDNIKQLLTDNQAVEANLGWGGEHPHCVGLFATTEEDSNNQKYIKLIFCNRSSQAPDCIGNIVLTADFNDPSLDALSELIKKQRFKDKNDFYTYLKNKITEGNFISQYFQYLKKQKMGNCSLTSQKSLLAAILPEDAYKETTTELRKEQIEYLLGKTKTAASKNKDLSQYLEFIVLKAYLQQKTVAAFSQNNRRKLTLIEHVISELKTISSDKNQQTITELIDRHQKLSDLFTTKLSSTFSLFERKHFTCKTTPKNHSTSLKKKHLCHNSTNTKIGRSIL